MAAVARLIGLVLLLVSAAARAQEERANGDWKGPFGGGWSASLAVLTEYSFRGISQTERQPAFQGTATYLSPPIDEQLPLRLYVGGFLSNVSFPDADIEIDLLAGVRLSALGERLTFDLGFIRYFYPGAPGDRSFDFSEFAFQAGYDFGPVQLNAGVNYSPNDFGGEGIAWYKWAQLVVPLDFLRVNENISFKAYGGIGHQFHSSGLDSYWDWQIGLTATIHGFALTLAYIDTTLDMERCLGTHNCQGRAIFTLSRSF